ncbi:MAG: hypothetical protein WBV73_09565 [Phormidium sp.]
MAKVFLVGRKEKAQGEREKAFSQPLPLNLCPLTKFPPTDNS